MRVRPTLRPCPVFRERLIGFWVSEQIDTDIDSKNLKMEHKIYLSAQIIYPLFFQLIDMMWSYDRRDIRKIFTNMYAHRAPYPVKLSKFPIFRYPLTRVSLLPCFRRKRNFLPIYERYIILCNQTHLKWAPVSFLHKTEIVRKSRNCLMI